MRHFEFNLLQQMDDDKDLWKFQVKKAITFGLLLLAGVIIIVCVATCN